MQKRWNIKKPHPHQEKIVSSALEIDPVVARLLVNRHVTTVEQARHFFSDTLEGLHDPFLLKGMREAIARIALAKERHERVLVFGDYDVDGVTSSALLYMLLTDYGLDVINHIPHRMDDGYGLNHEIVDFAVEQKIGLLVTTDCGITAVAEVESLRRGGIDVVIIDHHEPDPVVPNAVAVVDPKQTDCPYPFKQLAAVGLVVKFAQALLGTIPQEALDLAAVGTVADVVPLIGENRIIVKCGLAHLNHTTNKGLGALLDITKIRGKKISPFHIGFVLGPRINAAGRMDTAHTSLDLFLSKNSDEAYTLACALDKHNIERQQLQRAMVEEAFAIIDQTVNFKDQRVIVISREGWHKGVLGIVASKVTDKYYRPTIVISVENGIGTASARSVDGFNLYDALSKCSEHLERFGGHEGAAGLQIKAANIDRFRDMINGVAEKCVASAQLLPSLELDAELPLSQVTMSLADAIDTMQPFGEGNPLPLFCSKSVTAKSYPKLMGKDTIKFWVTDGEKTLSAVGFGMAEYKPLIKPGQLLDIAYQITIDDWNKTPVEQLTLKDICPAGM